MRFFTSPSEAERYAKSRPYFHPLAIARAKKAVGIERKVPLALDVACGTGQSTTALLAVAERVIGVDISRNMLAHAVQNEQIQYIQAQAESLPFQNNTVSLITTALAFHWFDRDQFLGETWRVLNANGLFLIYNNGFTGIMKEEPAFQNWSQEDYLERFPIPPRAGSPLTPKDAAAAGFTFLGDESYENEVSFTPEALIAYLATQTNVAAAIAQGRETLESASHWLLEQVRPFFANTNATFVFRSRAWYLRKEAVR